jgi:serine hydrolase
MKRVILVHGWEGTPDDGWNPWLRSKLEDKGFKVSVPAMPDTNSPTVTAWVQKLVEITGPIDSDTYFVGHSLGCITILRYLETIKGDSAIGGAILVAGFAEDLSAPGYEGQLSGFFADPIKWDEIIRHCPKFVVFNSDNDQWVDRANLEIFEKHLAAEVHLEHNMGHFSGSEGMTELPIVFYKLLEISGTA